jgi:hypothetical protein
MTKLCFVKHQLDKYPFKEAVSKYEELNLVPWLCNALICKALLELNKDARIFPDKQYIKDFLMKK